VSSEAANRASAAPDKTYAAHTLVARREGRVRQHLRWLRRDGLARLVEEDDLHPIARLARARRQHAWRSATAAQPPSRAVFVVGAQRSGTNLVLRTLAAHPALATRNENDRRVFRDYQLRDDRRVIETVERSAQHAVVFKPLCDSHRVDALLALPFSRAPRAVWVYRNVDDRVRSAVRKFGSHNRDVLAAIAAARTVPAIWQAGGLEAQHLDLIRSLGVAALTPESGAALFWYLRNVRFFDLALHERTDVLPLDYDAFVARPGQQIPRLCRFLDLDPAVLLATAPDAIDPNRSVPSGEPGSSARRVFEIDGRVRARCDDLAARFAALQG
jgi:hypothetical protein